MLLQRLWKGVLCKSVTVTKVTFEGVELTKCRQHEESQMRYWIGDGEEEKKQLSLL